MRTKAAELLGADVPIFAFSHCRDVVSAVTRAGGIGVFGASHLLPEQLDIELKALEKETKGLPYAVDVHLMAEYEGDDLEALELRIPAKNREFVAGLVERFHIPPPKNPGTHSSDANPARYTHARSRDLLEVAFAHNPRMIVSAMGPPPRDIVDRAHDRGLLVAGLIGDVGHAVKQRDANVDLIIAVGTEGGGHVGEISTMVLIPQVVDAVSPLPVIAAGGIGTGRQVAAALALGAEGVWSGSIWLTTYESEIEPDVVEKLIAAGSRDARTTLSESGKRCRFLRTPWTDAWEGPDSPGFLPAPLQGMLVREAMAGAYDHRVPEVVTTAVGQIVGTMNSRTTCAEVVFEMASGFGDAVERLVKLTTY